MTEPIDKKALRKSILERRSRFPDEEFQKKSAAIAEALFASKDYKEAQSLFVFISVGKEPDTSLIIGRALADGKTVYVPRTAPGNILEAVQISLADGSASWRPPADWPLFYGIPEPPETMGAANLSEVIIDIVIVPSLAVDTAGYRLGYGGGYYDRLVAINNKPRPLLIAIQFAEFLTQKKLPRESHDMPVDIIITNSSLLLLTP